MREKHLSEQLFSIFALLTFVATVVLGTLRACGVEIKIWVCVLPLTTLCSALLAIGMYLAVSSHITLLLEKRRHRRLFQSFNIKK